MTYVNLHGHSHYSLLDGLGSPAAHVKRAKELGMPAIALTEHGNMHGAIELYQVAKKEGIKPIIGCEIYIAPRTRFDKTPHVDIRPYHQVLIAKNNTGYKNLIEIVTKANLEGFYYKPRADYGLIKAHSEGLIALSGCLQGHLPRTILSGNQDESEQLIKDQIELFGKENYFLEVQDHPLSENQGIVNEGIKLLAKKFDLPIVATTDSHYPRRGDTAAHDVLLCIQTGSIVSDENRMKYHGDFSIRDPEDLRKAFSDIPDALENTLKVADMVDLDFEFGKSLLPKYATPQNEDPKVYLRQLCEEGLKIRMGGKEIPKNYMDRLDYELSVIESMGYSAYFLIVQDFVNFAKSKEIIVGPGRGSAAGAIVAWSLRITELDPIAHGLLFERFLNPERVSMPDVDIDFADTRRQEVLDYVIEKYGRENVAQIITFGTMAPKAAVRDVGRALGVAYVDVDRLSKLIPAPILGKHAHLKDSIKDDADLKHDYNNNPRSKEVLDFAIQLEGTVRHSGTHACAVVIAGKSLLNYTPLQRATGGGENDVITQYSMKPIEDIGLLKMDFLGLKNLTMIETTMKIVKRTKNVDIDIEKLDMFDKKAFKLLQAGETMGVFQLESDGMRRYLKELKPSKFEDIVAMGALYRPGPMEWIPTYIRGKHNPKKVRYLHSSFKSVLSETYGVAVYQEQILQLARDFAGFSLGEADILRKAVGKKIPKLLAEQREKFVEGAVKEGHKEQFADEVFEKVIEPFAGYGFNKAHAACYGLISYQTAYLKAHFPTEFMTALLCTDYGDTERVVLEINKCEEMGISVKPPSINESFANFTVTESKIIRFGLMAIKGLGEGPVREIIRIRDEGGDFKDIEDFARRVTAKVLNKKVIQALAYSGALDGFGDRNQIAESYEEISKYAKFIQEAGNDGQTDIFGAMTDKGITVEQDFYLKKVPKASELEQLRYEKQYMGLYISRHPLQGLKKYMRKKAHLIGELDKKSVGKPVRICGLISGVRKIMTRAGTNMAVFVLEDTTAKIDITIFPKSYHHLVDLLVEDSVVVVEGKFDSRRGDFQILCTNIKNVSLEVMIDKAKEMRVYDDTETNNRYIPFLGDYLRATGAMDINDFDVEGIVLDAGEVFGKAIGGEMVGKGVEVLEDSSDSPYVIELPQDVDKDVLAKIKELLTSHKGETTVVMHIQSNGDLKRIKVPFGVNIDEGFENALHSIIGG